MTAPDPVDPIATLRRAEAAALVVVIVLMAAHAAALAWLVGGAL